jgi:23S rRNA pseudouridine1911/1915/1917 synthase
MYLTETDILYEDNHVIAVKKKTGELVQADKTGILPLAEHCADYIKHKYNKPGNAYIGIVHRIDRPVTGVILFAKSSKGLERFNLMFKEKTIHKKYWAIVKELPPKEQDTLIHYIRRNTKQNKSYAYDKEVAHSKRAELDYRLIASSDRYYLLEIVLKTGRHHQIRSQLSKIGCPIKGDKKYGYKKPNKDASIHLHARSVEFVHPVKKESVYIECQVPDENLWKAFEEIVK